MKTKNLAILISLPLVCSQYALASDDTSALKEDIRKLKSQVKMLEFGNRRVNNSLSSLKDMISKTTVNGYLSVGFSTLDGGNNNDGLNYFGIRDAAESQSDMIVGLQFDTKVSDRFRTSIQFASRGLEQQQVTTDWAYFAYDVTNELTLRGGRLRIPFYSYSEAIEVGYAYPWVRPPKEVYNMPLNSFEGFDIIYSRPIGNWQGVLQAYFGSLVATDNDRAQLEVYGTEFGGLAATLSLDDLTFRLGYHQANINASPISGGTADQALQGLAQAQSLSEGINAAFATNFSTEYTITSEDAFSTFSSVGMRYDDGDWFLAAEYAHLKTELELFPAGDSGYIAVGKRFGSWMPHLTVATFYSDQKNDAPRNEWADNIDELASFLSPLGNAVIDPDTGATAAATAAAISELSGGIRASNLQQDSYTLGLNYTFTPGLKFKLEATHIEDFGGTQGLFSGGSPGKNQQLYSVYVDAVF